MKSILSIVLTVCMVLTLAQFPVMAETASGSYVPKTVWLVANSDGTVSVPEGCTIYIGDTIIFPCDEMIMIGDFTVRNTNPPEIREMAVAVANDFTVWQNGIQIGMFWSNTFTFSNSYISTFDSWFEEETDLDVAGTYSFYVYSGHDAGWTEQYLIEPELKALEIEVLDPVAEGVTGDPSVPTGSYVPKTVRLIANNDGTVSVPEGFTIYIGDTLIFPRDEMIMIGDFTVRNTNPPVIREMAVAVANDFTVWQNGIQIGMFWNDTFTFSNSYVSNFDSWFEDGTDLNAAGTYSFYIYSGHDTGWTEQYLIEPELKALEIEVLDPVAEGVTGDPSVPSGLYYTISEEEVTVAGYIGSATQIEIPAEIQGYPVTAIGYGAFASCSSLSSVTIPDSVKEIGESAFVGCSSLSSINIPNSVTEICDYAFYGCSSLSSIDIPDSVTKIGDYAFHFCYSLSSIDIPDSVTKIGEFAFTDCYSLTEITVSESNPNYSSADGVLFDKDKATLLQYPAGKVGEYTIPDSVKVIGEYAFYECYGLSSIEIPNSVKEIGFYAFFGCSSLSSIDIPDSVTVIDDGAFSKCYNLTEITVSESNPNYSSADGVLFDKDKETLLQCPAGKTGEYIIPNGVTRIADYAFYECTDLSSVTIPYGVTEIGYSAFFDCSSLSSVTIPGSVTKMGDSAFYYCTNLNAVTIHDGITEIGDFAFLGCENLTDVYYTGSEADRENINILPYNDYLTDATWHYNYPCDHVYDDDADVYCNQCGEERVLFVYGNANGDNTVDGRDVILLCQYLANYDYDTESSTVEIAEGANANGDNTVDGRDVILLCQYLANYDYDTGSSTVVLGPQR